MTTIDIPADVNDEDETGLVWTFLDQARDPAAIRPGAVVITGDDDTPVTAQVVDIVDKPSGAVVHLRVLSGRADDVERHRAHG